MTVPFTSINTDVDSNVVIKALAEMESQVKRLREETKTEMSKLVANMFKTFFDTFPEIKTIHWTQYTPYFNDGDPCEFRLDSIEFNYKEYADPSSYKTIDERQEEGEEEDEEFDVSDGFCVSKYSNSKNLEYELYRSCVAIEDVIKSMAPEFEAMLGNNLTVFVTKGGMSVEEYEPGY